MNRSRGASLGLALSLIALAMLAAFTLAASSSANLQVTQRVENTQVASHLAQSAVQRAIASLMANNAWQGPVDLTGPGPDSEAHLTFQPGAAPYSTNNSDETRPSGWSGSRVLPGGQVPPQKVHLVAVGRCRNVTRTVEAVVHIPNFTVSVASNGRVVLENSLVGSLKEPADLARLASEPELLGPGDLATNSAQAGAVTLDRNSRVTGNVQSVGTVSVLNGSRVDGEVRAPWSQADLPAFDLDEYDPENSGALNFQSLPGGVLTSQDLVGLVRCEDTTRIAGDLRLDNALLFVEGDLIVEGGLVGTGAVMVTGATTIRGGVNLTSDDSIALLGEGNVTLEGDRPDTYEFHGIIYTAGNFTARNFTIVGSFIANGTAPGTGNIELHDSRAYFTNVSSFVPIFYPRQMVLQIAGTNNPDQTTIPLSDGNNILFGQFPGATLPNPEYDIPWKTPAQAAAHVNGLPHMGWEEADSGPWHWYDTVLLEVRKENDRLLYELTYQPQGIPGAASYPERFTNQDALINRLTEISQTMCPDYNDGESPAGPSHYETPEHRRNVFYPQLLQAWSLEQPPPGQPVEVNFSFDPNRFLQAQDKIRVATWQEY